MKITVQVNFDEMFNENESVGEWVEAVMKTEILRELKKHPEYKEYIQKQAEKAIQQIQAEK